MKKTHEIMKKTHKLFLMMVLVVIFSVGCGPQNESNEKAFAVVIDQMGREVVVSSSPERVVSLSPSHTETAFAIGLENSLVGVTDFCNYPAEALEKDKVGGFSNPNVEAILALEPDLVLAGNRHEEQIRKLEEMGIAVLVLAPDSIESVFEAMILMAEATGKSSQAAVVLSDIRHRFKVIETKMSAIHDKDRVRVYYEVYSDPLMSAGGSSIISEVISTAGGINIFADVAETHPKISEEVLIQRDPQFILFPEAHGTEKYDLDKMVSRPLWNEITAVKEKNVYGVSADSMSRPGPRLIEAVENLAAIFYPEMFK